MGNKFFDLTSLANHDPDTVQKSAALGMKYLDTHFRKIVGLRDLMGDLPSPGEAYFLWTVSSFNAFTFITYILDQCEKIEELILSTYSINMRILEALMRVMDKGIIDRLEILVADSLKYRMPKVYHQLGSFCASRDNMKVKYAWNHSKVTLIKAEEAYYVAEGSGNWSENARNEQYVFINSKELYQFRKEWIQKAMK